MQSRVFEILEHYQSCATIDEAWDVICGFAGEHQLPRVSCCYGALRLNRPIEDLFVRGNFSPNLGKRWKSEKLYRYDPAVPRALKSPMPFCWGFDYLPDDVHPGVRQYYAELLKDGARSMLVVPLRCDPNRGLGLGMVGNDLPRPLFETSLAPHASDLTLAIQYADQRMVTLTRAMNSDKHKLGPREAQCLEMLTAGHKNVQIADKLGISVHTVQLHLDTAKRKLGAATREQAIARAISFRLIRGDKTDKAGTVAAG